MGLRIFGVAGVIFIGVLARKVLRPESRPISVKGGRGRYLPTAETGWCGLLNDVLVAS